MRIFLCKRFAFKSNITHYDAATNSLPLNHGPGMEVTVSRRRGFSRITRVWQVDRPSAPTYLTQLASSLTERQRLELGAGDFRVSPSSYSCMSRLKSRISTPTAPSP